MPAAAWYPDPADGAWVRWWDGGQWTAHVRPAAPPAPPVAAPTPVTFASYARREGDRVAVPAAAVAGGLAPDRCAAHGNKPVEHRRITFLSPAPWWILLLVLVSILIALLVALLTRKKVTAPAWPLCAECVAGLRRSRWITVAALLAMGPLVWGATRIGGDAGVWAVLLAVLVPLTVALAFGSLSSARVVAKAKVSVDGFTLTMPARVLPPGTPAGGMLAVGASTAAGVAGQTLLPGR